MSKVARKQYMINIVNSSVSYQFDLKDGKEIASSGSEFTLI
jgi:hypothetical protein